MESQVLKIHDARTKVPQSGPRTPGQAAPSAGPHPRPHAPPPSGGGGALSPRLPRREICGAVIQVLLLSYPHHPFFTSYRGKVPGNLSRKGADSYRLRKKPSERKTARSAMTWTLIPRDRRACQRARAPRPGGGRRGKGRAPESCPGPWRPGPPAAPKVPGGLPNAPRRCPNLSQPADPSEAQVTEAGPARCLHRRPPTPSPTRRAANLRKCPGPGRPGAAPRPLLTWPEGSGRYQEAEHQATGGGRPRCHIPPPPRGPPTESAPQEGASSRAPRSPRAQGSGLRGQRLPPDTLPPGAVALHLRVCAARNFPQRSAPTLPPSPSTPAFDRFGCSSGTGDPLFPGDT